MKVGIGVDVGGTHITAACIDFDKKQILDETICTIHIDNQSNALYLQNELKNTIIKSFDLLSSSLSTQHTARSAEHLSCIGLAFPGPFDYNKGISKIQGVKKYDNIFGLSLKPAISACFEDFDVNKISFLNDADCFLCGEYWLKDLSAYNTIVGITLGTGFGSSYIKKETPDAVFTKSLHTGFFYQIPYKDSIANDYISTGWVLKRWKELTNEDVHGVKEIAEIAETDKTARDLFNEFGYNLTELLIPKLEKLNAEMLVIGGNIAKAHKYFLHVLKDKIKEKGLKTQIIIHEETDKSALCGAAYYASENLKAISSQQTAASFQQLTLSDLADKLAKEKTVIIEGHIGLHWEDLCEKLERILREKNLKTCWWSIEAGLEEDEDIVTKINQNADGSNLADIFNAGYLKKLKPDEKADINIIYCCGASLSGWKGLHIYIDTPENKIPVLTNHKKQILSKINLNINLTDN